MTPDAAEELVRAIDELIAAKIKVHHVRGYAIITIEAKEQEKKATEHLYSIIQNNVEST